MVRFTLTILPVGSWQLQEPLTEPSSARASIRVWSGVLKPNTTRPAASCKCKSHTNTSYCSNVLCAVTRFVCSLERYQSIIPFWESFPQRIWFLAAPRNASFILLSTGRLNFKHICFSRSLFGSILTKTNTCVEPGNSEICCLIEIADCCFVKTQIFIQVCSNCVRLLIKVQKMAYRLLPKPAVRAGNQLQPAQEVASGSLADPTEEI